MNSRLKEQLTFVAIRRLMRAVLGNRKRGQLAGIDDTRVDPVRVLSGTGGFYTCFPDPMTWQQLYMRGMDVCPYVDAFWRASHDVGVEFSPVGATCFDEERECYLSTDETFQQLGERIHFHWAYSDLPASDKYQHLHDWALKQSVNPAAFIPALGGAYMLGSFLLAASRGFMDRRQNHGLGG